MSTNWEPYYKDDIRPKQADLTLRPGVPDFVRADRRPDPYDSGLWPTQDAFSWEDSFTRRALDRSIGQPDSRFRLPSVEKCWSYILDPSRYLDTLTIVACLSSYRTLLFGQVAGFVRHSTDPQFEKHMHMMFGAGVVDRGVHSPSLMRGTGFDYAMFAYHLNKSMEWQTRLLHQASIPQRWATIAGSKLSIGGQYTRHNILTSELLLRASAYLPVTVAGESHAFLTDITDAAQKRTPKRGDGIIVRDDDYIICIETTASMSLNLDSKILAWADFLGNAPSGRSVVFLEAMRPDGSPTTFHKLQNKVGKVFEKHLSGRWHTNTVGNILLASWRRWNNPGPTEDFARLVCHQYDNIDHEWREVDLLGDNRLPNDNPTTHIHRGFQSTFVTPPWTREDPLPVWAILPHDNGTPTPLLKDARPSQPPLSLAPYRLTGRHWRESAH